MLEAIAIPILMKAVDFIFGEGSKILGERRERRKAEQEATKPKDESDITQPVAQAKMTDLVLQDAEKSAAENVITQPTVDVKTPDIIQSKEVALHTLVAETAWQNSEAEIKYLMDLLEIHTRNYRLAKEQYAKWGSALVPPIVVNNLIEEENAIASVIEDLQLVLSKVYAKKVSILGIEQA